MSQEHPTQSFDLVVIGGGPAGLAAAIGACREGVANDKILILERDRELGGILNQCIHNGFGLHILGEELTGPEYAAHYIKLANELGIPNRTDTMVMDLQRVGHHFLIQASSVHDGHYVLRSKAVVLAMGCRERPRGAILIPGSRPAGIYSAGTAQRLINMEGVKLGKEVVIIGSGDIGLIMARRMSLTGAKVKVVAEMMPRSSGLTRNIVQCLHDFDIPLRLSAMTTQIHGRDRIEGVTIADVDEDFDPISGSEVFYSCDTLLLATGLIPENELSLQAGVTMNPKTKGPVVSDIYETSVLGLFACGNVERVHDLVDHVTEEALIAGKAAAEYVARFYRKFTI